MIKFLLAVPVLSIGIAAYGEIKCQMLLPEKEQQSILADRWMYPQGTKLRLSAGAVRDGYVALDKNDCDTAMQEFNRAWRMNPENFEAYWGAAIVFGLRSLKSGSLAEAESCIANSLVLMETAKKYLPADAVIRENWQLDYAASYYTAGEILLKSDWERAVKYFKKAESLWLPLLEKRDLQNERDKNVCYRIGWHLIKLYRAWGKTELSEKYLQQFPPEIRKKAVHF